MVHVERSRRIFGLACLVFAELVGGADWSNCGRSDDVVMHFPDPHGKGFPTKYSLTDWGGDFTDSIGGRLDLNGMVFSGKKEYLDGLVGSSTVQLWNGYPQYYSTKKVPGTNAWFALRRSQNGHLLLQRTDRHTNEGDAKSYVGIQLFPAALPLGTSGKTWKFSPGNTDLDGLPSSQFDVTIRLDCCKTTYGSLGGDGEMGYSRTIKKVTWSTPGIWSDARGLGSKCGKAANGFPNGVRKRSVKCGGQSDCQTCAYTDETDTKPATLEAYTYACGTVATTKTTATIPCTNVPYTITVKTKIDCTAQGTRYKVTLAECRAKQPCQCDGNNPQGSIILDETDPCCNWQGDRGATLPGTHCGEQPQTWVTYWCPCAKCIGNQPSSQLVASGSPACCPTFWKVIGGWQIIKDECGDNGLQQARTVNCYQRTDDGTDTSTTNGCPCLERKPETKRSFNGPACTTSTSTSTKTTATTTATTSTSTTTTQTTVTTVTTTTIYDPQNVDCVEDQDACTPECQPAASRNYKILVQQAEQGRACDGPSDCDPGTDACPTADATQATGNRTATVELATNILLDAQVRLDAAKAAVLQGLADPSVSADVRTTIAAVLADIAAADVRRSSISDAIAGAADSIAVFLAVESTAENRNSLTAQVAGIEAALSAAINFVPAKTNIQTGATDDDSNTLLTHDDSSSQQQHPASKSAAAVAVPVVLLLLAASVAGIAFVIRRIQNGNLPLPAQGNNVNVVTNQTFDNTATPMARTGSVVVLGNNRQRYLVPMEPERVRPAPSADGGSDSDYVPPSAAQARAYDMNPLLGAYDRSVQLAVYEEVDEDAGSSTTAAPPTAQLGADGYMDDSSVNQPQEIEYATAAPPTAQLGADGYMDDSSVNQPQEIEYATAAPPTAQLGADGYMDDSSVNQPQEIEYATAVQTTLSDTADYSVSAPLPSTAVYSPPVGSTEVVLAAYSSHV